MTQRKPDARDRERLEKLCRQLGTDNPNEADNARAAVGRFLLSFGKTWSDLIELLSGAIPIDIDAGIAADIAALGDPEINSRNEARQRILALLAHHRKNWNDLTAALTGAESAPWLASSPAQNAPERDPNLIGLIRYLLHDYVHLRTEHEYTMVALWALHTHVYNQFMVTPRIALRSPVPGCGKTQLIDVLTKLVSRPKKFDSITTAALYRLIDESHPTLFIDEADNLGIALQPNGRLRAVFNSGHRHGGKVAVMEKLSVTDFSTFAPLLLALPDAFQGLPRTLDSRCITLMMERSDGKRKLKRMEPFRPDGALNLAHEQILIWRNEADLNPDPEMPEGINNRLADNWRPLLSIADNLGWGEQAREAMGEFAGKIRDGDAGILLLEDIRKVFGTSDRMVTQMIIERLLALDDSDWSEFRGAHVDQSPHRLKATELALMLRSFGIRPRTVWPLKRTTASKSQRGYYRHQFEDAWRKYCPDDTTTQSSKNNTLRIFESGTA